MFPYIIDMVISAPVTAPSPFVDLSKHPNARPQPGSMPRAKDVMITASEERLYAHNFRLHPELAGKLTGMSLGRFGGLFG